ncbi:hypothetical protein ABVF11_02200 [Pediococcus argentinicus]|uniref:hypothetical protein n=1 Tax=Pediococcus argentinicus TaxID=480391 RepID=UPI00338D402C
MTKTITVSYMRFKHNQLQPNNKQYVFSVPEKLQGWLPQLGSSIVMQTKGYQPQIVLVRETGESDRTDLTNIARWQGLKLGTKGMAK